MEFERLDPRLAWLSDPDVRPFALARPENLTGPDPALAPPFTAAPLIFDPLANETLPFLRALLRLDAAAYGASQMGMPQWVFYDCALLPGLTVGFARRRSSADAALLELIDPAPELEWIPLSMFIAIPAVDRGEWIAHNLASTNPLRGPDRALPGLGFLTKAFGLWWGRVGRLCGVAQWGGPAVRLHAHFGRFEVLSAFAPIHTHPATLTYRTEVDPARWADYFAPGPRRDADLVDAGFTVSPKDVENLKSFQRRLEERSARYYLNANQIRSLATDAALNVYKRP